MSVYSNWKYFFDSFWKFVSRNSYPIVLVLFFIWICIGIFPLTCYESDSMHVIAGCNIMYNQGLTFPPVYSYLYEMQPLVTYTVVGFKYIFPFLTCEQIYCLLSAICGALFIVESVNFVYRITSFRKIFILLSLFLIPESFAISMYPNSAIFAAVFFVCALNRLLDGKFYVAMVLMVIAPLYRIDILIVYPVVFFIFLFQRKSVKESITRSVFLAVLILLFVTIGYWGLRANPLTALTGYNGMNETHSFASQVKFAVFTFYTILNFVFVPMGLVVLFREKKFGIIGIALIPIILIHFMFRYTGCAPKHYLYLIPFVSLISVYAMRWIYERVKGKPVLKYGIVSIVVLFLCLGIRIDFPDSPWRNVPDSDAKLGPYVQLFRENYTKYHVTIGVGVGQLIPTLDEYMLLSGNLFYPFYIHEYKTVKEGKRIAVKKWFDEKKDYNLLACSWEDIFYFPNLLLEEGYEFRELPCENFTYELLKGDRRVTLYTREIPKGDIQGMVQAIDEVNEYSKGEDLYIVSALENQDYLFNKLSVSGKVRKQMDRLYKVN